MSQKLGYLDVSRRLVNPMKYKNVHNAHIEIGPHRFLEPNGVIDLSEEELKEKTIRRVIHEKNWLAPIGEQFANTFATAEANDLADRINHENLGPNSITNNYDFNVNFPIGHGVDNIVEKPKPLTKSKKEVDVEENALIQEGILRAKQQAEEKKRLRGWNPMDDAYVGPDEEEANIYKPKSLSKDEYGNREIVNDVAPISFVDGELGQIHSISEVENILHSEPTQVIEKHENKATKKTKKKEA